MLQIFFKTSQITAFDWENAYKRVEKIVDNFPLQLLRVKGFNGFVPDLDKEFFDLRENKGTEDELISFYSDFQSFSHGQSFRIYKNWDLHQTKVLKGSEINPLKPLTWLPNDSGLPSSNGMHSYTETGSAPYETAIIAIAIMLESQLKGKVFLIANKTPLDNVLEIKPWVEHLFDEEFELPIYFDKKRLLKSFENDFENKTQIVYRFDQLFVNQHKRNISFAIENIGYQASFEFYAQKLAKQYFRTFGFYDVLDPWITVTQDLESALNLISESKKYALEINVDNANKYDYSVILKKLLNEFILWTPLQREELEPFYTNKEALETGSESLWGTIYRMTGNRVDICPIYSTQDELFEAFMYLEPKNGAVFKQIIDDWVDQNSEAFYNLKQK